MSSQAPVTDSDISTTDVDISGPIGEVEQPSLKINQLLIHLLIMPWTLFKP
jgi:hypothetical protein